MNKFKKHILIYLLIIPVLLLTFSCKTSKVINQSVEDNSINIENTIWSGIDSDGDFYEYNFLAEGRLEYKTNTSREDTVTFKDETDIWSQNGNQVIILIGNTSVQVGTIVKDKIEGHAWNKNGRSWTWIVTKQEP